MKEPLKRLLPLATPPLLVTQSTPNQSVDPCAVHWISQRRWRGIYIITNFLLFSIALRDNLMYGTEVSVEWRSEVKESYNINITV